MLSVDKFLCFELETGGQFWGWLGIITNGISVLVLFLTIILLNAISCDDVLEFLKQLDVYMSHDECRALNIGLHVFIIISIILLTIGLIILSLLIIGIRNRNHCQILPAVIVQGIDSILIFIMVPLTGYVIVAVKLIFLGIIWFYMFIVLLSLYEKFKNEKRGTYNAQFYFILSCLLAVLSSLLILLVILTNCQDTEKDFRGFLYFFEKCYSIKIVAITSAIGVIILSILVCFIFKRLINGINEHNHKKMAIGIVSCGIINTILTVVKILEMFSTFTLFAIFDIVVYILIYVYFFICLYSLYVKIREEDDYEQDKDKKVGELFEAIIE